jgi:PAS domain S-box-containing protein
MNLKRSLTILLTIVCFIVLISGSVLYRQHEELKASSQWVAHTYNVISRAEGLYGSTEDLISAQRGYLLSKDSTFLTSYTHTSTSIDGELVILKQMTADNLLQQIRLTALHKDMNHLRQMLEINIQNWSLDRNLAMATTLEIKSTADSIRGTITDFLTEEKNLLIEREEEEKNEELYYFYTLFGAAAASLLIMLLANGVILSLSAKHRAAAQGLSIAERDLYQTRERLELAMRGTSDGVFDWNLATGETYFSPRFREMLGYTEQEFPNSIEVFKSFVHPEDSDLIWTAVENYLIHKVDKYIQEFRIQHKDGSWRWHLARGALPTDKNEGQRLVGAHTDITEQKETEVRLRASNKELEEFTYIASHDLRSPLVNLKGFASELEYCIELLRDFVRKALPVVSYDNSEEIAFIVEKDMPQALSFISSSVTKMEKLTRAILELSRVGRRKLEFEPLHVSAIIDTILKTLQHQISTKQIRIVIGDLPNMLGDPVAIEQVFANIIDNAIKYMDPRRQSIIEISGTQSVSETTYHIRDNGRGIRDEDLKKVFEIFKRAGNNDNIPGEGMGMSYVQTILRRHGGTIWCTSTLGQGTDFYFSIPHHVKKETLDV